MGHGLVPGLAIVVADGGREAGLGHVSRSSALATALGQQGLNVRCFALGAEEPLERDGVRWQPLGALRDAPLEQASVLVLDSYRLGRDGIDDVPASVPVVVLQEHLPPPDRAALIVSAGSGEPPSAARLTGLEYVSLRPSYWSASPRDVSERIERVLVTTGGGDVVPGLGAELAAMAAAALPDATVTLVRGPFGTDSAPPGIQLLEAPDSLHAALLEADVVVTAAGQTLLEAAALGTPAIAVVAVENQRAQATRLADVGAVRVLELPARELPDVLRELEGVDERQALARNAQRAVDGRGAERVAGRIAALL